jgi:Arc/MetJ-type ribon-helix-helix transcriptional regulator
MPPPARAFLTVSHRSCYSAPMSSPSDLTSMTVSLPAAQKAYVKAQAAASGCSTPSEYIRRLIHADQKARAQEDLERRVLEGLDAETREMSPEAWQELRSALRREITKPRRAK